MGWDAPDPWNEIRSALEAGVGPVGRNPAQFRSNPGENLASYAESSMMRSRPRTGSDFHTDINVLPLASFPSVRTGVINSDALANPNPAIIEAKRQDSPSRRDISSSPAFGTPDYSGVYEVDEEIKTQETKGRSFLDGLEQQILGRDSYAEKLSGLYRRRGLVRQDAESKFAAYVKAHEDPNAPDRRTLRPIKFSDGTTHDIGWTLGGQRYDKQLDKAISQTKARDFPTPMEEEGTGNAVIGYDENGVARLLKSPTVTSQEYGPQTEDMINTESKTQEPVATHTSGGGNMKIKKEIDPSRAAADTARIENTKRDNARKAGDKAYEDYVKLHSNDLKITGAELEAGATKARREAEEFSLTGKRPVAQDDAASGHVDYVMGRDKDGKLIATKPKR